MTLDPKIVYDKYVVDPPPRSAQKLNENWYWRGYDWDAFPHSMTAPTEKTNPFQYWPWKAGQEAAEKVFI